MPAEPRGLGRNEADSKRTGADWKVERPTYDRTGGGGADREGSCTAAQTPGLASEAECESQTGEAISLLQPLRAGESPRDAASGVDASPRQRRQTGSGWNLDRADRAGRRGSLPCRVGP